MKIAIVNLVSQTPPGRWALPNVISNRQSVGVQFGRALKKRGHQVTVFMSDAYWPENDDEGVTSIYVRTRLAKPFSPALIPFTPELVGLLARGEFDLVVCSELFQWSTVFCAVAKRRGGFRLFVWQEMGAHQRMAGGFVSRTYHWTLGRLVIKRTDAFLPRAEQPARFLQSVGVPRARIGPVIPNGADGSVFRPGGSRDDNPLVLCVGSLVPLKQPGLAIKAMPLILEQEPEAKLLVKGSGPMEHELRMLATALGLEDRVIFDFSRSDHEAMAALYRRGWVGLFPTNGEGASLSPVEMVMCGTPVVVAGKLYHSGVLKEQGGAEVTGFEVQEIADATVRQIRRIRTGEWDGVSAAQSIDGLYSTDSMAERLISLHLSLGEG